MSGERIIRANASIQPALYMLVALSQARFTGLHDERFYLRAAQRLVPVLRQDRSELVLLMAHIDAAVAALDLLIGPKGKYTAERLEPYKQAREELRKTVTWAMRGQVVRWFGELEELGLIDPATRVAEEEAAGAPAVAAE